MSSRLNGVLRGPIVRILPLTFIIVIGSVGAAYGLGIANFDLSRPDGKGRKTDATIRLELKKGESRSDIVYVTNTGKEKARLFIYAADGSPARNGGVALTARTEKRRGLSRWIQMDASSLSLAPGETRAIRYTVSVPSSSTKDEYIGGIVVETASAMPSRSKGKIRLKLLPRAAILVIQRIPGRLIEAMRLLEFRRSWEHGKIRFHFLLKNLSNIHQDPSAQIKIYTYFSHSKIDTLKVSNLGTIFPKRTASLSAPWKKTPWLGYYLAEAKVTYGKNKDKTLKASMPILIFPWWLVIILAVAIFTFAWSVWEHRRQEKEAKPISAPPPPGFPPASGQ